MVRTMFGPEDEDAFIAARDALVDSYGTASQDHEHGQGGFIASVMLDYKWGYGDGRIADWRRTDVEDLLLGFFPRKVTLDEEELLQVVPAVMDFLSFLDRGGQLSGDPLPELRATAEALVPEFVDAMSDPADFGMAKRLFAQMQADGVDIEEPSAVEAWLEGFNERGADERDDILAELGLPPATLPPIELPPPEELERMAADSAMLARLAAFARAIGPGRKLTQKGHLTLADGRSLVASLGTGDVIDERIGRTVFRTRSTAELGVLDLTFRWARAAGFVKVRHGRVSITRRGDALGRKPLHDWGDAFDGLVKLAGIDARRERVYGPSWDDEVAWISQRLPRWLYEGSGLELELLQGAVWQSMEAIFILSPDPQILEYQRQAVGNAVDRILGRFVDLDAIVLADGAVSLTPLGLWATNRSLRAEGVGAPVVGELADSSAADLIAACAAMPLELAEQEMRSWIGGRPESAIDELAEAARSGAVPMLALHALSLAGPTAEAAVRAMLDVPELRAQALLWLVGNGYEDPDSLSPEALREAYIEVFVALLDGEGPVAAVAQFGTQGSEDEQLAFVEGVLRAEHPRTSEVLMAIGHFHPSKAVAKAARKAAFKRQAFDPA